MRPDDNLCVKLDQALTCGPINITCRSFKENRGSIAKMNMQIPFFVCL